ncbi:MAG: tetratricopeptide repeat protein, partial [Planctomycetes bacterium]|nr:tetratricopeptide repeat protein [Planctomycetota bacterium]
YTEAYLCLGWLHSKNGDIEKAIPAFRKAIELMPDSHDAYLYLGNLYVQKGEIQDALDEYNKACEILSKKAQDAMAQGLASIKKGDIGRAIDCFNEALRVEPASQEAYAFLADAYEKKGLYSVGIVLRLQGERLKREAHNF